VAAVPGHKALRLLNFGIGGGLGVPMEFSSAPTGALSEFAGDFLTGSVLGFEGRDGLHAQRAVSRVTLLYGLGSGGCRGPSIPVQR